MLRPNLHSGGLKKGVAFEELVKSWGLHSHGWDGSRGHSNNALNTEEQALISHQTDWHCDFVFIMLCEQCISSVYKLLSLILFWI